MSIRALRSSTFDRSASDDLHKDPDTYKDNVVLLPVPPRLEEVEEEVSRLDVYVSSVRVYRTVAELALLEAEAMPRVCRVRERSEGVLGQCIHVLPYK